MKNRNGVIFGTIVLLLLTILLITRFANRNYQWTEKYTESSKDPYTLFLAAKVLKNYYPDSKFYTIKKNLANRLKKTKHAKGNYFFIGHQYYVSDENVDTLLQFVSEGNNAFIATKQLPYRLIFRLFGGATFCGSADYYNGDSFLDSMTFVNFIHPNLKLKDGFQLKKMDKYEAYEHDWNFIPTQYICDSGIQPVGLIKDKYVNFGFIPYGKGRVYFHTNPIVFTNYYLMQNQGKVYFDGVMAHLPEGNIYYDIAARKPQYKSQASKQNCQKQTPNYGNEGPLTYILTQRSLAIAWYLLLGGALLYLTFRGKRKQRVIPIVDKNENTSLIFVQNISNLYFQQGDNKQLSLQKFAHFQDFVRTKYALNFKNNDSDFAKRLSQKSGVSLDKITKILTINQNINSSTFLSDNTMTRFHLAINHFYQNCK